MEGDGALIVQDAASFEVLTRLPVRKLARKYNVWNKISRLGGTSH